MKAISARKVKMILHQQLGLHQQCGNRTGHEVWADGNGRRCHPVFRHKDMPFAALFTLGEELEGQGICGRQAFIKAVKSV